MTIELTHDEPGIATPAMRWFLAANPTLLGGIETVPGLDDRPMLFNPDTGKYVALTPTASRLVRAFDGRHSGATLLAQAGVDVAGPTAARIAELAHELRQLGFLTDPAVPEDSGTRASRFAMREHMPRKALVTNPGRYLEPIVAPFRDVSARWLVGSWLVLAGVGVGVGVWALTHVQVYAMPQHTWLLLPILFVQIAIHETAHAVVCQYLGAPVRSAGIGLMLYVMPVGYVDRTDSHRVRSRSGRVMISMAGPLSDQIWFGVAGIIALTTQSPIREMAVVMMVFQIILTVMNFNPVTPSDGYHAVTAALGIVNLRGKSLAMVVHTILRTTLPPYLARASIRERRIMVGYGFGCLAFMLVFIVMVVRSVLSLFGVLS